jgi:hypothetical protein
MSNPNIEQHGPTGPRSLPHRSPLEASVSPQLKWYILGAVLFWVVVIYLIWA